MCFQVKLSKFIRIATLRQALLFHYFSQTVVLHGCDLTQQSL